MKYRVEGEIVDSGLSDGGFFIMCNKAHWNANLTRLIENNWYIIFIFLYTQTIYKPQFIICINPGHITQPKRRGIAGIYFPRAVSHYLPTWMTW